MIPYDEPVNSLRADMRYDRRGGESANQVRIGCPIDGSTDPDRHMF